MTTKNKPVKQSAFRLKEVTLSDIQQLLDKTGLRSDADVVRYAVRLALASDVNHLDKVSDIMTDIELEQLDFERAKLLQSRQPVAA